MENILQTIERIVRKQTKYGSCGRSLEETIQKEVKAIRDELSNELIEKVKVLETEGLTVVGLPLPYSSYGVQLGDYWPYPKGWRIEEQKWRDKVQKKFIAMVFTEDIIFSSQEEEALLYTFYMEKKHYRKDLPAVIRGDQYFHQLRKLKQKNKTGNWKLVLPRFAGLWHEDYRNVKRVEGYFPNQCIRENKEWVIEIRTPSEKVREALNKRTLIGAVSNKNAYSYYHDWLHFPVYYPARLGLVTHDGSTEKITKIKDKDGKVVRENVESEESYTLHEIHIYPCKEVYQHGRTEKMPGNESLLLFRTFTEQYFFRWSEEARQHASKFLQLDHDNPYLKK